MLPSISHLVFWLPITLWPASGLLAAASVVHAPIVDLGYAQYQGVPNAKGNIDFLGVRYAAPPTGSNRFRKPQPPAKSNRIQLAETQPNRCVQGSPGTSPVNPFRGNGTTLNVTITPSQPSPIPGLPAVSEDCLFLNVVVPGSEISSDSRLPVIVWIHGGGYIFGSSSYPGPQISTASFFDGNDLVQSSGGKAIVVLLQYRLGLYGFLAGEDVKKGGALNAGLRTSGPLHRLIQKFGGDPDDVTIWGLSAGAGSVAQHLIANGGNTSPPLFSRAILNSFVLPPQYHYNERIPERNALAFSSALEGAVFVDPALSTALDTADFIGSIFPTLAQDELSTAAALYSGLGNAADRAVSIMGEAMFICPPYSLLRSLGGRGYKGLFAIPPALHGDDQAYYFPSASAPAFNNTVFIDTFAGTFVDFAVKHTPNADRPGSLLPQWPRWSESSRNEVVFNRTGDDPSIAVSTTPSELYERCRFWESRGALTSQ